MHKISILTNELRAPHSLSAEHWLSSEAADSFATGTPISDVVSLQKKGTSSFEEGSLILDTGHTDRGLFILPDRSRSESTPRTSHKKIAPEGAIIISRLRPYLKQVAYIPKGMCELIGVSGILCSTEYYVLESKDATRSIAYLVPWLLSDEIQNVFVQATTGGHHPRFNDDLLMRLSIPDSIEKRKSETSERVEALTIKHIEAQMQMHNITAMMNN